MKKPKIGTKIYLGWGTIDTINSHYVDITMFQLKDIAGFVPRMKFDAQPFNRWWRKKERAKKRKRRKRDNKS